MVTMTEEAVREPALLDFNQIRATPMGDTRRWLSRAQNFQVEMIKFDAPPAPISVSSGYETILLLPDAGAAISRGSMKVEAAGRSVCILPSGSFSVAPTGAGQVVILSSERTDLNGRSALNEADYSRPDARIVPVVPYRRLRNAGAIEVLAIDQLQAPADNPRLKMLQSDTLSINWVEYEGGRDRSRLSPHSHKSIEQGSLALAGDFVHHLRVEWGRDAALWRDDLHARLPSPSLMVVPVGLIHTSEGTGAGHHLLIDIFAPPRREFIAKGWVLNSGDYAAPD